MLQTSKLTSKFQATLPSAVRAALQLRAGDLVGFEVKGSEVMLRRATTLDVVFAKALEGSLQEWDSPQDQRAFADL